MLTFMTRIPIKIKFPFDENEFRKGIWYIPVIGFIIGVALYGVYLLMNGVVSSMLASFIIVVLYLLITGGLHIDGLADTLDATGSNQSRTRMLEIMKDSHIGTFGVLGIVVWFTGMVLLINEVPWACIAFPVVGRSMSLFTCSISKYARKTGLGKTIIENTHMGHFLFSLIFTLFSISMLLLTGTALQLLLASVIAFIIVFFEIFLATKCLSKKLGGITGDIIGYVIEFSSFIFLLFTYLVMIALVKS